KTCLKKKSQKKNQKKNLKKKTNNKESSCICNAGAFLCFGIVYLPLSRRASSRRSIYTCPSRSINSYSSFLSARNARYAIYPLKNMKITIIKTHQGTPAIIFSASL